MDLCRFLYFFTIVTISFLPAFGQERPILLTGRTVGQNQQPVPGVNIQLKNSQIGTYSDQKGRFKLKLESREKLVLLFSALNYESVELSVIPDPKQEIVLVMKPTTLNLPTVEITEQRKTKPGTVDIDPLLTKNLTNTGSGSVEQLVKTMPGVSSHSELSPQYSVRGGNFDENLVYVNGIEIFRPFLVKTGEQEGLSYLNPDLVSAIRFSSGGFESSYGDKMSSVLDIDYKVPGTTSGTAELGALGASAHLEGRAFKNKFSYLTGIRYRDNRYLLGTLDQKGHYNPSFFDFQMLLGYDFTAAFSVNVLANISNNNYSFIPETRETNFGTLSQSYLLRIYFDGHELDQFANRSVAATANYHPSKALNLQLTASNFYADEKERYDILGQYSLNEVFAGSNPGTVQDSTMLLGVGSTLSHAGNFLQASIFNIEHRGRYNTANHRIQWGIKFQSEHIHDQVKEWVMKDSAGYSLPNGEQKLELFKSIRSDNILNSNRLSLFLQDNYTIDIRDSRLTFNYGGRMQFWDFNHQTIFSPRFSVNYFPGKIKHIQFHAAWGIYQQMPFFKELKNIEAQIVPTVRAQKSVHYLAGVDYPFYWGLSPFKFTSEIWYKKLNNLIPYKVNNLDLQYLPGQQSDGYAAGLELKIIGEPIPGATSWASLTLMKTEEDIRDDSYTKSGSGGQPDQIVDPGFLPRPTDQRAYLSLFFQDYLPKSPTTKLNLTLLLGSKLPFGPPTANRYQDVFRMPAYKRVDLGFSKALLNPDIGKRKTYTRGLKDAWLTFEIFNLFDLNNTISYYWVSDYQNNMYAVPNYLTGRRLNLKMAVSF